MFTDDIGRQLKGMGLLSNSFIQFEISFVRNIFLPLSLKDVLGSWVVYQPNPVNGDTSLMTNWSEMGFE